MEGLHHSPAIGSDDAAAAGLGGAEGEHCEQAFGGALPVGFQQTAQVFVHGVVGMDQEPGGSLKEALIGKQGAGCAEQLGLMDGLYPHGRRGPISQESLHLIRQVMGVYQHGLTAGRIQLPQPTAQQRFA